MDEIAEQTGGRAFYNTNGLAQAIATSTNEGSNYYSLSYNPTNTRFDGRVRRIRNTASDLSSIFRQIPIEWFPYFLPA